MVVEIQFDKENMRFDIPKSYPDCGGTTFLGKIEKNGITGNLLTKGKRGDLEASARRHSYWD
jgi:hypothetical protein